MLFCVMAVGCGSSGGGRTPAPAGAAIAPLTAATVPATATAPASPSAGTASALVFAPPVIAGRPQLSLDRSARQPAAVVGYDLVTTTFSYVRWDDRQTDDFSDRFVREAISERVGISFR